MNIKTITSLFLVIFGMGMLAYSGFSFAAPGRPLDFLGLHVEPDARRFLMPIAGALAIVGGIVLLRATVRRTS